MLFQNRKHKVLNDASRTGGGLLGQRALKLIFHSSNPDQYIKKAVVKASFMQHMSQQ